jgi:hypothetical protein
VKALTSEQQEALRTFKGKLLRHPQLQIVLEETLALILNPAGPPMGAVIGPTGAGKTTLLHLVEKSLAETHTERLKSDPGFLPFVTVEARSPEDGSFKWKRFFEDVLDAGHEIQVRFKTVPPSSEARTNEHADDPSTAGFRVAVEHMLRHRGMPVLLIDESQHFLKMASGRRLLDQMDALKSISNLTGVKIVLFGNYDLLSLGQLSDQLARRCREIHFRRYRLEDATEVQVFQNVLGSFQRVLPMDPSLNLLEHWKYMYRGALGTVGNLKGWLEVALMESFRAGRSKLSIQDVRGACRSEGALAKMAEALQNGETKWEERKEHSPKIDTILGLDTRVGKQTSPAENTYARDGRRRPGERNQVRDQVGLQNLGAAPT